MAAASAVSKGRKKEAEVNQVEWEFTNGTGISWSFHLERDKRLSIFRVECKR